MSASIPVIKIMGEGELADAGLVKNLNFFIGERAGELSSIHEDEEYISIKEEYDKVVEMIKEKVGHDMINELDQLNNALFLLEQDQVYLRGLHDGYLLGKLLEKGATLTYRRFKQENE